MDDWRDFVVTRDASGRLYVARCAFCGHLIAASPDRPIAERLAGSHQCDMRIAARAEASRAK
jgi:hypothetical protein